MASNGDDSATESEEFFDEEEGYDDDDDVKSGGGGDDDPLGGVSVQSSSYGSPIAAAAVCAESDGDASHVVTAITGVKQELLQPVERLEDEPKAPATTPLSAPTSIHVASLFAPAAAAATSTLSDVSRRPGATAVKHESHMAAVHHSAPPVCAPESKSSPPAVQNSSALNTAPSYAGAKSTQWSPPPPATHASSVASISRLPCSEYKVPAAFQASRPSEYASSYGGSAVYTSPYPAYNGGAAPFRPPPPVVTGGAPGPPAPPVYGYRPPPPVDYPPPRTIQTRCQNLPASEVSSISTSAKPKAASSAATSGAPRASLTPPPPKIPSSLAVQQSQPAPSVPTQADTAQSLASTAPASAPTVPVAAPVAPGPKCSSCKLVLYKVQPSSVAADNLQCSCCKKTLLADVCFSRNQRATGKNRCKACLGQANLDESGEPLPTQPLSKKAQKRQLLQSREGVLGAERQVAKYHLARRSLQRKREANDLRGSTRVEYEKQLAKEDEELKALEKQLRAKYPQLFDKQSGIQVKPPSNPRDERDRPLRTKKSKKLAERAEQRAKKKKEQQAAAKATAKATAAAARVAAGSRATSSSAPEVVNLTDEPGPETIDRANPIVRSQTTKAATAKAKVAKPAAAKAKAKAAVKSTTTTTAAKKRKEAAASGSTLAAKEKPTKKPKTSKTTTSAATAAVAASDDKEVDPWLAAHDEIAQGLSQLLGGNLDDILGEAASGSSGVSESKKKKPAAKPAAKAKTARSQVKQEVETDEAAQQQHVTVETPAVTTTKPTTFSRTVSAAAKTKRVKTENWPPPVKMKNEARPDPSTYAPKTKLQAETPPRTTIVTRARKRALEPAPPVEIIDMTDSPKAASSSEKKPRFLA